MPEGHRREDLVAECAQWALRCGYKGDQLERGFEALVAATLAGAHRDVDLDDGKPENHVIRDDDLGIDIVLPAPTLETLILAQAKWTNPKKQAPQSEDEVRSFFAKHDALMNPEFIKTGGERAQELLGAYPDQIRDGWGIDYYFVTTRTASVKIRTIAQEASETFAVRGLNIACHFLDLREFLELKRHVSEQEAGLHELVELQFPRDKFLVLDQPRHHLVAEITGRKLRDLYKQYGERLFSANIRLPLSMQSGKNKRIRETASTDPADFLFYNNGVSAVCDEFTVVDNRVTVRRLQIVNGAQTTGAIGGIHELPAEVSVLFRLTASGSDDQDRFIDNVIRFNNTQTPVRDSDFRSNDPIQEFLGQELNKFSGRGPVAPFFYQHKRGLKQTGAKHRVVTFEDLARIRYSYLYDPILAYRRPSDLWTDETQYAKAFGIDGEKRDRWPDALVAETAVMIALADVADAQAKVARDEDPKLGYLVRLDLWVVGLFGQGLRELRKTRPDPVALAASRQSFTEAVEPLIEPAFASIMEAYERRLAKVGPQIRPEYNLARDPSSWDYARDLFAAKVQGKRIFSTSVLKSSGNGGPPRSTRKRGAVE